MDPTFFAPPCTCPEGGGSVDSGVETLLFGGVVSDRKMFTRMLMAVVVGLGLFLAPTAFGESCEAKVDAALQNMDSSDGAHVLVFEVTVRVDVDECSAVDFELVIEEVGGEQEPATVRKRTHVKVNGGEMTSMVRHQIAEGRRMSDYRVEVVGCHLCEPGD